ncbi:MAG: hypothetical protein ACFE9L_15510 [Candidatus Hodarchaeota archaeon]
MPFNTKNFVIGTIFSILLAILVLSMVAFVMNLDSEDSLPDSLPPPQNGIGYKIATSMEAAENNVEYVWSYNNTFTNLNLSTVYGEYIDGIRISKSQMVLINEPLADFADIEQSTLNNVMGKFYDAISSLTEISDSVETIMDIIPPTLIMDIAYEDNTSISLVFSKTAKVVGVINGTWTLTDHFHHGVQLLVLDYILSDAVYLSLSNLEPMFTAISTFENFIYDSFPL